MKIPTKDPSTLCASVNAGAPDQFRVATQIWSESLRVLTGASFLMKALMQH